MYVYIHKSDISFEQNACRSIHFDAAANIHLYAWVWLWFVQSLRGMILIWFLYNPYIILNINLKFSRKTHCVQCKYVNKSSIIYNARDSNNLVAPRSKSWGAILGDNVCDSDTLVVIVWASAALTDFFPSRSPLRREKKKRAEHTFPSIFVHNFGALTGGRVYAPVVRNVRVLGCPRVYAWQTLSQLHMQQTLLVRSRSVADEERVRWSGTARKGLFRAVVTTATYVLSKSIASFYGSPLTRCLSKW